MKCTDPDCRCLSHVTADTHVPACPYHLVPLRASSSQAGEGFCGPCYLKDGRYAVYSHKGLRRWAWLAKETVSGWDLPPHDGMLPVDLSGVE